MIRLYILILITCFLTSNLIGDSVAPPYSYTILSPNEKYIFVMLSPLTATEDAESWIKEKADRIHEIRAKYNQSGLYLNNGSITPLWTVNWYSYSVKVCSDGIHIVRPGPWASFSSQEAIAFFAKGKLLKSYRINQLLDFPFLLPHSVSHFRWKADEALHNQEKHYRLVTLHGETYNFDITTGAIINSFRLPRWIIGVLIVIIIFVIYWRKNKGKLTKRSTE